MEAKVPMVYRQQDDDGQEWFTISHVRYSHLEKDPAKSSRAGYQGTEKLTKFSADGVVHELTSHFALDEAAAREIVDATRR